MSPFASSRAVGLLLVLSMTLVVTANGQDGRIPIGRAPILRNIMEKLDRIIAEQAASDRHVKSLSSQLDGIAVNLKALQRHISLTHVGKRANLGWEFYPDE